MIASDEEVGTAYENFVSVFHPGDTGMGYYFWNFIGAGGSERMDSAGRWDLPPEAVKRVRALAGPHYRSIAKAMQLNGADPFTHG